MLVLACCLLGLLLACLLAWQGDSYHRETVKHLSKDAWLTKYRRGYMTQVLPTKAVGLLELRSSRDHDLLSVDLSGKPIYTCRFGLLILTATDE